MAKPSFARCEVCQKPLTTAKEKKTRDGLTVCKFCADTYWGVPDRPRKTRKR